MPMYCFKCSVCGLGTTARRTDITGSCSVGHPSAPLVRDYRAEGASFNEATLKRTRDGNRAYRDMFLPTAKDFESPSDPDGSKGIRKWNDEHTPHSDASGTPLRPEIKRRSW